MTQRKNHKQNPDTPSPEIQVGDLVRIRHYDWLGQEIGVVTEIRELVHDQTGAEYTVITAVMGDKSYTFSAQDFEIVSKVIPIVERKEEN